MSENINSEALDRLLELDGQFYDKPDLVRMARIRADVLHASAAWGSSEDGGLLNALADEVERLRGTTEVAANALAWAERRMACQAYAEVIANDERNARAALKEQQA